MPRETPSTWIQLAVKGEFQGTVERTVSAERMKLARVKMERDIL